MLLDHLLRPIWPPKADSQQAITWALEREVDIITMSFGSVYMDKSIDRAINRAAATTPYPPIFLAAASNSGLNSNPTYPATHPSVIGVHSLDGLGNDNGGLNPSRAPNTENFGTLGVGIEMLWDQKREARSGSSYAAPIAAGIAANNLAWMAHVHRRMLLSDEQYTWLRTVEGIRHMFRKQSMPSGDLHSIAPWVLWREDPSDGDPDRTVCGVLKHSLPLFPPDKGYESKQGR